jgi:DNA-binding transcriptional ArsR family regulator
MGTKEQERRRKSLRPHPARDKIVDALRTYGQPLSPTRLAEITGDSLGATAYHVRTLLSAGVVELADEGRVRGAVEHFYQLADGDPDDRQILDPVQQLMAVCGVLTIPDPAGGYPQPSVVDVAARTKLTALIDKIEPEVRKIVTASTKRAAKPKSQSTKRAAVKPKSQSTKRAGATAAVQPKSPRSSATR